MKKVATWIFTLGLCCTIGLVGTARADGLTLTAPSNDMTQAQWHAFSKNLVRAMATDNQGLRTEAMRLIIQYAPQVDVDAARFDLMRVYRNHSDERARRMAVVALGKIQDPWAMGFLRRAVQFEQSECVRQTITAVLAEYEASRA